MKRTIFSLVAMAFIICMWSSNVFAQSLNQGAQVKTIFSFKKEIALTDDQEIKLKAMLYDEQTLMDEGQQHIKNLGIRT